MARDRQLPSNWLAWFLGNQSPPISGLQARSSQKPGVGRVQKCTDPDMSCLASSWTISACVQASRTKLRRAIKAPEPRRRQRPGDATFVLCPANCKLCSANCVAYCVQPTVYCILPTVYCALSTAYCALQTVHCTWQLRVICCQPHTGTFQLCIVLCKLHLANCILSPAKLLFDIRHFDTTLEQLNFA